MHVLFGISFQTQITACYRTGCCIIWPTCSLYHQHFLSSVGLDNNFLTHLLTFLLLIMSILKAYVALELNGIYSLILYMKWLKMIQRFCSVPWIKHRNAKETQFSEEHAKLHTLLLSWGLWAESALGPSPTGPVPCFGDPGKRGYTWKLTPTLKNPLSFHSLARAKMLLQFLSVCMCVGDANNNRS